YGQSRDEQEAQGSDNQASRDREVPAGTERQDPSGEPGPREMPPFAHNLDERTIGFVQRPVLTWSESRPGTGHGRRTPRTGAHDHHRDRLVDTISGKTEIQVGIPVPVSHVADAA